MRLCFQYCAFSIGSACALPLMDSAASCAFSGATGPRNASVRWIFGAGVTRPSSFFAQPSSAAAVAAGGQTAKKYRLLAKLLSRERCERALGRVGRFLELGRDQLPLAAGAGFRGPSARLPARLPALRNDNCPAPHRP